LIASWQGHGLTDDAIYNELEVMFPSHGHPLSHYHFIESFNTENHDIAIAALCKVELEWRQVTMAALLEYEKKRKCMELERVE
jgi:hypothetical protein